nr:unnamed protein product [Callosobruchus chinensis]
MLYLNWFYYFQTPTTTIPQTIFGCNKMELHLTMHAAIRAAEELSLAIDFTRRCQQSITELAPAHLKARIKATEVKFLLKLHKGKPMHGIFYKHLEEHGLSQQLTFSFLRSSGLKSETDGFKMACQDGAASSTPWLSVVGS